MASSSRKEVKGSACATGYRTSFSNDRSSRPGTVCRFYEAGNCSYGTGCRYDHVKPKPKRTQRILPPKPMSRASTFSSARGDTFTEGDRRDWSEVNRNRGGYSTPPMASSSRKEVLCRYYSSGCCALGDRCSYSHDRSSRPDTVCRFYQAGKCTYGTGCRYDHVKPKRDAEDPSAGNYSRTTVSSSSATPSSSVRTKMTVPKPQKLSDFNVNAPAFVPSWKKNPANYAQAAGSNPTEKPRPLCPYFQVGDCPKGDNCDFVHGIMCEYCLEATLHPFDPAQQQRHIQECLARHEQACETAFVQQRSSAKECGICLEKIWEKEMRFGILEKCNHCFCLDCIRNWRKQQEFEDNVVRSCPECRVHSNFVIPSVIWVEDEDEKKVLLELYKENTKKKVCKYYKDTLNCPFGMHCFYKHQRPDGSIDPGHEPHARPKPLLSSFLFDESSNDEDDPFEIPPGGIFVEELTDAVLRRLVNILRQEDL